MGHSPKRGEGGSPTLSPGMDAGRVCPRALQGRKANQAYTAFHGERGQFGMDAEIRTHQALHEAKPSECPKGNRDNKSEVYFKNRLFQQTEFIYLSLSKNQFIFENGVWGIAPMRVVSRWCRCVCASTAICAVASCNGFVWLSLCILA